MASQCKRYLMAPGALRHAEWVWAAAKKGMTVKKWLYWLADESAKRLREAEAPAGQGGPKPGTPPSDAPRRSYTAEGDQRQKTCQACGASAPVTYIRCPKCRERF